MNACWALEQSPAAFSKNPKPQQGGGYLWDYAATACIYHELQAWVSDMNGQPLNLNAKESPYMNQCGVCYATGPSIARC
jgi:3'-phosphoadenosine 5'-phosphosulfate (PAPS) 3'-phosphatase